MLCLIATDLPDRKQAQQALEQERQHVLSVLDNLPVMVCLLTPSYDVAYANRGFIEQFGQSHGRKCYQHRFGKDQPCEFCESFQVLDSGLAHDWEVTTTAGRQLHAFDFPFTDSDGSPLVLEMDVDVTDQREAERKLWEASLYTRSLFEASLDPLVTINPEGKITDVNQGTENVTGADRGTLVGSDFCDYFTAPQEARRAWRQAFAQGSVRDYPLAIRHKSGQVTEVLYNAKVFRNQQGEVEGVFAAARDVTAKKLAEDRLQRVNRMLRVLSECTQGLMKATDEASMLQKVCGSVVNGAGYRMAWVGYAQQDEAKNVQIVAHAGFEEGYLQNVKVTWGEGAHAMGPTGTAIRTGEVMVCADMQLDPRFAPWRKDAQRLGYRSNIALPLRSGNEVFGALTIYAAETGVLDPREQRLLEELANNMSYAITVLRARKQREAAERDVRQLNQKLEQRVQERTVELTAVNKELEAFCYAVAHDLRAPLRHIHGFSAILQRDASSNLSADGHHCLECIVQGTVRMEKLLEDLLNLSRLGRQAVHIRPVPLTDLVQEVIEELAPDTRNRLVEWQVAALPVACCDRSLLKIVLTNLLSNAVKFTRLCTTAVIEIGMQERDVETAIFVRDNGAGFDMRYAGKLFGVFQRLHGDKDYEGTGIGLATVRRILQKHGGRIWAQGEVGNGATFYFTLGRRPIEEEQPQPVSQEAV